MYDDARGGPGLIERVRVMVWHGFDPDPMFGLHGQDAEPDCKKENNACAESGGIVSVAITLNPSSGRIGKSAIHARGAP